MHRRRQDLPADGFCLQDGPQDPATLFFVGIVHQRHLWFGRFGCDEGPPDHSLSLDSHDTRLHVAIVTQGGTRGIRASRYEHASASAHDLESLGMKTPLVRHHVESDRVDQAAAAQRPVGARRALDGAVCVGVNKDAIKADRHAEVIDRRAIVPRRSRGQQPRRAA